MLFPFLREGTAEHVRLLGWVLILTLGAFKPCGVLLFLKLTAVDTCRCLCGSNLGLTQAGEFLDCKRVVPGLGLNKEMPVLE